LAIYSDVKLKIAVISIEASSATSQKKPARTIQCAVERRRTSVGEYRPTRQLSLQLVAVRADVEATKRLKPLM
jgi:hypothetical protein